MVVDNTPINVNNVLIENVPGYVYLGQHYSLKEKNQDKEIQQRIMAGWAAYAKHRDTFKSNLSICLKKQVYNSCVLPAMTYGAETWTLTKQAQNKLAAALTKMERSMLNITYKDRRTNIWVRERTKLIDIIYTVRKMKWSWAGHINRLKDDRWTSRVTTWRPYDNLEKTTRETSQAAAERRHGQILERHDMAEDSTRRSFGDDMLRPSPNHVHGGMTIRQTTANHHKPPQTTTANNHKPPQITANHHKPPPEFGTIGGENGEKQANHRKPPQTTANHHQNTSKKV